MSDYNLLKNYWVTKAEPWKYLQSRLLRNRLKFWVSVLGLWALIYVCFSEPDIPSDIKPDNFETIYGLETDSISDQLEYQIFDTIK